MQAWYNEIAGKEIEDMPDSFNDTIEKLKTEIGTNVSVLKGNPAWAQVEKLYRALTTIEDLAEQPQTPLAQLFGIADAASNVSVRPGEFIGMDALDAAKAYLEKKKAEAASLDEIVDALQKGGANTVSRDTLSTSLARSTWDVVKAPGQELYQLVKFSPHVKRGKKKTGNAQAGKDDTAEPTDGGEADVKVSA